MPNIMYLPLAKIFPRKKNPLYATIVSNSHLVETKVLPVAVIVVNSHIFQPKSKGVRIWCVTLCCSRKVFSLTPRCSTMASSSRQQGAIMHAWLVYVGLAQARPNKC